MITVRSRIDVSFESMSVAVSPPTSAVPAPRASSRSTRSSRTVCSAAAESAASVSVPISRTSPSETVGAGAGVPGGPTAVYTASPSSTSTVACPVGESSDAVATDSMPSLLLMTPDRVGDVRLGHDHVDRAARTGREVLGEHVLAVAGLRGAEHEIARGHAVGFELQHPGRSDQQDDRAHDPDRSRVARDEPRLPRPQALHRRREIVGDASRAAPSG